MTESGIDLRQEQAAEFKGRTFYECSQTYRDYDMGDFIAKGIFEKTVIQPINDQIVEGTDATDLPVAWRLVVPAPQRSNITLVEFGTGVPGLIANDEARFSNEMHIDQDVDAHADHPAVRELFMRVGGDLVNLIKRDNGILFSGIERVVRVNPDSSGVIWNRLAYSDKLLATSKLVDKHIAKQRSQGLAVPEWLFTASLPKNRRSSAAAMALSSLYAFRSQEVS